MFLRSQLRLAVNGLKRSPQFTLTSILTLSLAIGTLVFAASLAGTFLYRPLPYPDGERLMLIRQDLQGNGFGGQDFQTVNASLHWYRNNRLFEKLSLSMPGQEIIAEFKGEPKVPLAYVTADYVEMFSGAIILGRNLAPAEELGNKAKVVLLSEALWKGEFAASPDVLGEFLRIQDVPHQIIGVVSGSFAEPLSFEQHSDLWLPFDAGGHYEAPWDRTFGNLRLVGKLKAGVTAQQAAADLDMSIDALRDEWQSAWPDLIEITPIVTPFRSAEVGDFARNSVAFLVATFALFLIAVVNIASLFLTRVVAKQYLLGLQSILGATERHLTVSAMTESVLICGLSGLLSGAVYLALMYLTRSFGAGVVPLGSKLGPDLAATIVALATTAFACFALSFVRIRLHDHRNPLMRLKGAGRGSRSRVSRTMLISLAYVQLTLAAAILLFTASIAWKSLAELTRSVNVSIENTYNVFSFMLASNLEADAKYALGDEILSSLKSLPAVEGAAHGSAPLDQTSIATDLVDAAQNNYGFFRASFIGPGYLELYGIALTRGRDLSPEAYRRQAREILVTEDAARKLRTDGDVIGMYAGQAGKERFEIVGVTENVHDPRYFARDAGVRVWWPYLPTPFKIQVRTKPGFTLQRAQAHSAIKAVNENLFLWEFNSIRETYDSAVFRDRVILLSIAASAALTLLLALSGIFGLVSYHVHLLAQDIGIRLAIGATSRNMVMFGVRAFLKPLIFALVSGALIVIAIWMRLGPTLAGISEPTAALAIGVLVLVGASALSACIYPIWRLVLHSPARLLSRDWLTR